MRYALIGCGRIAVNHLKAVRENGLELVAACDLDAGKIKVLFDRAGMDSSDVRQYSDHRVLLAFLAVMFYLDILRHIRAGLHSPRRKCHH